MTHWFNLIIVNEKNILYLELYYCNFFFYSFYSVINNSHYIKLAYKFFHNNPSRHKLPKNDHFLNCKIHEKNRGIATKDNKNKGVCHA